MKFKEDIKQLSVSMFTMITLRFLEFIFFNKNNENLKEFYFANEYFVMSLIVFPATYITIRVYEEKKKKHRM